MTFATALALLIAGLAAIPYLAHRLRRKRAEEIVFPAARLVPIAPPIARKRARLEDKALLAIRILSIAALALLGATPFVSCSKLSMERSSGASFAVAFVIDDSMSMRISDARGNSRFQRAKEGALDILSSTHDGDSVAIVLAGAPARVALAATSDFSHARAVVRDLTVSDRATDLDGAILLANSLIGQLPQIDKRIVVLSDRADGNPEGPPLGEGSALSVWFPLKEEPPLDDCALLTADRTGNHARVRVTCTGKTSSRDLRILNGDSVLASKKIEGTGEAILDLPSDAPPGLIARLSAGDAIQSDDVQPVLSEGAPGSIAIVADAAEEMVATGGATVVEQALSALKLDVNLRPVPLMPDRDADLISFSGIVLEDPSGFTPEQRRSLGIFLERGGAILLALGRKAATPPLGATFEPILMHGAHWGVSPAKGIDPRTADTALGESIHTFDEIDPKGRITLAPEDTRALHSMVAFTDGQPLVAKKEIGRGVAWIVTLPFSVNESDLALRPGFLSLLSAFVDDVRARRSPKRSDVGDTWVWDKVDSLQVDSPKGTLPVTREGGRSRVSLPLVGSYTVHADKTSEIRAVSPVVKELNFKPRAVSQTSNVTNASATRPKVDISWQVALVLLAFTLLELIVRYALREKESKDQAIPIEPAEVR